MPRAPVIADLVAEECGLEIFCSWPDCGRKVRWPPDVAVAKLGAQTTFAQAPLRLRCSVCGTSGKDRRVSVRPDQADVSRRFAQENERRVAAINAALAGETDDVCNRYGYLSPVHRLKEAFEAAGLDIYWPDGLAPNLEPQPQIRPTNKAPILLPLDPAAPAGGLRLERWRWGLVPWFHKKAIKDQKMLGTNARSETVAQLASFKGAFERRRCLIPADQFYEWTGPKGDKTMWKIARADGGLIAFAGLWDHAETADGPVDSFTMLTTAAGPDMEAIHDRQPVILEPPTWSTWLDLSSDVRPLFEPASKGHLVAVEFREERA